MQGVPVIAGMRVADRGGTTIQIVYCNLPPTGFCGELVAVCNANRGSCLVGPLRRHSLTCTARCAPSPCLQSW